MIYCLRPACAHGDITLHVSVCARVCVCAWHTDTVHTYLYIWENWSSGARNGVVMVFVCARARARSAAVYVCSQIRFYILCACVCQCVRVPTTTGRKRRRSGGLARAHALCELEHIYTHTRVGLGPCKIIMCKNHARPLVWRLAGHEKVPLKCFMVMILTVLAHFKIGFCVRLSGCFLRIIPFEHARTNVVLLYIPQCICFNTSI